MIDEHVAHQLTASRCRWVERPTDAKWHEWIQRSARRGYGGRLPSFSSVRIHSLPGSTWEVRRDARNNPCLVADDELTATLAELRLLSMGPVSEASGYDKCILMLADAFRSNDDSDRYAVSMGWAMPRAEDIRMLRRTAFAQQGSSVEAMVVLFHELAHTVLAQDNELFNQWRVLAAEGVDKVSAALATEGRVRELALETAGSLNLSREDAERQISMYLAHLKSNEKLLEEICCDMLAALAFLNLKSANDVVAKPFYGPAGMDLKEVGDALLAAHGAIQNMQFVVAVPEIAASASTLAMERQVQLQRPTAELTARTSALAFLLSTLLRSWCVSGSLRKHCAMGPSLVSQHFLAAIAKRNQRRARFVLGPLEDLDGVFHEPARFEAFRCRGFEQLAQAGLNWPGKRNPLHEARWDMVGAPA